VTGSLAGDHPALGRGGVWTWGPIRWRFTGYREELDDLVSNVVVVPFVGDRCVLVRVRGDGVTFPGGTLEPGEHWVSTAARELREEAGATLRGIHPIGLFECRATRRYRQHLPFPDHRRVAAWADVVIDGVPSSPAGAEDIAEVLLVTPGEAARMLVERGRPEFAELGLLAAAERTRLADEDWFRDVRLQLETLYLAADDPYLQSGKSGGAASWEMARRFTAGAIHRDGTFLDVGCANGLLMESMVEWTRADRGFRLEPHGLDISPALVGLARRRLPVWADRIWAGNGWDWVPPRRFDFVHTLPELVPDHLRGRWLRRLVGEFLEPGGRLILRFGDPYPADPDRRTLGDLLAEAGLRPGGELVRERPAAPAVRWPGWRRPDVPRPAGGAPGTAARSDRGRLRGARGPASGRTGRPPHRLCAARRCPPGAHPRECCRAASST